MKNNTRARTLISLILAVSLLALPITAFAKKGEKNFKRGMDYERQQQWDKIAAAYPFFTDHQAKISREIPLIALERKAA